jgi:Tol biopolymer transport system component
MAQRFDTTKLQTIGDPVAVAQQVDYRAGSLDCAFSASQNGTLVYIAGGPATEVQLTWFDSSGHPAGNLGTPASQTWPAISPDGAKVAIDRRDHPRTGFFELWLYDLKQGNSSRFTFNSDAFYNLYPIWSPDGSHIAFSTSRSGSRDVYQKAVSGGEPDEVLDHDSRERRPTDWSRDGKYIIEDVLDPKTKYDIWLLPRFGDHKSFPYLQSEVNEDHGKLSPSGLWLAYSSDETKQLEIYVQAFPKPSGKRKISTNGGSRPVWSRDGKQLFFFDRNNRTIMAVDVNSGPNFQAGAPHALFDARQAGTGSWFDVGKDGRFLIPVQPEEPGTRSITVVLNWEAGLKK